MHLIDNSPGQLLASYKASSYQIDVVIGRRGSIISVTESRASDFGLEELTIDALHSDVRLTGRCRTIQSARRRSCMFEHDAELVADLTEGHPLRVEVANQNLHDIYTARYRPSPHQVG